MTEVTSPHIDELYSQLQSAVILMVDDEPLLMEILEVFLEEKGYSNFIKIEDSTKAIGVLEEEAPDVVLLDLNMPNVDGFDILASIRASEAYKHLPVIVLTSSDDPETKLRALDLGATDFLAKPVDASELALRLRNTLTAKAYQEQLTYYDLLTLMPNRTLFIERVTRLLKKVDRENRSAAVLDIGLDRFKQINESFGPSIGDQVLKQVASRLMACVRSSDVVSRVGNPNLWRQVGRVGGDEFAIALAGVDTRSDAQFVAACIHRALQEPFVLEGEHYFFTASIGIAIYPENGDETDRLIKNAAAATAFAKQQGRSQTHFYSADITAHAQRRLTQETRLRQAIENEEFVLHYQPKVDAKTGSVGDCEALVRWNCPERGLLPPGEFIPLAEEAGLILPLGDWIIGEACRQQAAWRSAGICDVKVAVNVAGVQFSKGDLRSVIRRAIGATGIDPSRLNLEITESMLMDNAEEAVQRLNAIREDGPRFSIDDFGTGYSSLSHLKRLPVDELKIDRSFIVDVPGDAEDRAIVKAIIAMAHSLELTVVAEGIESAQQFDFLRESGCDLIQGYFSGRPMSPEDFAGLFSAGIGASNQR